MLAGYMLAAMLAAVVVVDSARLKAGDIRVRSTADAGAMRSAKTFAII